MNSQKRLKLSPQAVSATNKAFWNNHPEMNGRLIKSEEKEGPLGKEWMEIYTRKSELLPKKSGNKVIKEVIMPCTHRDAAHSKNHTTQREKELCKFSSIKVSKPKRKYDLVINPNAKPPGTTTLEVICGEKIKTAIITAETSGLIGPCQKNAHQNKVYYIPFRSKTKTDTKLEFEAVSYPVLDNSMYIADFFWPRHVSPKVYSFNANTCGTVTNINVNTYPDIQWEVSLGFELEFCLPKEVKHEAGDEDKPRFEYSIKAEKDGKTALEITSKTEDKKEDPNNLPSFKALKYIYNASKSKPVGLLKDLWGVRPPGSLSFKCKPNLSANWGWEEIEGSPNCDFAYAFKVGFNPLLEITGKLEFAGPMLLLFPTPVGPFLAGTKKLLELTKTGEIAAELIAQGSISITGSGTKYAAKREPEFKVTGEGFVLAQFELRANCKFDIVIFSVGSGFTIGARTKWKLINLELKELNYGAALFGTVDFEGLKCYYQAYLKAGFSQTKSGTAKFIKKENAKTDIYKTADDPDNDKDGKLLGYIIDPCPGFYEINIPVIGKP